MSAPKPVVEESAAYDNFLNQTSEVKEDKNFSIFDFMNISEEELQKLEEEEGKESEREWKKAGMPEFVQEDNPPYKKLIISFRTKEDYDEFAELIGQKLTEKTKSIWHPKLDRDENSLKRWIELDD